MKLIIDIPEEVYKFVKGTIFYNSGRRNGKTIEQKVLNSVDNGIPYEERPQGEWIKVKDQLPVVPEGKQPVDVLVIAKVYFVPDHIDQRDWTYVVEKATYEPKYGFYGNNIYDRNVKEWMYAPEMPKRYARYVWRAENERDKMD